MMTSNLDKEIRVVTTMNSDLPILWHVFYMVSLKRVWLEAPLMFMKRYREMGIEVDMDEIEFETHSLSEAQYQALNTVMIKDNS